MNIRRRIVKKTGFIKPPYFSEMKVPRGFRTIAAKLSAYVRLTSKNMEMEERLGDDGHYFYTIARLYRGLVKSNRKLAEPLSRDLINSELAKRMNGVLNKVQIEGLTESEIQKILTGTYAPATSFHADAKQILARLEEVNVKYPRIEDDAVNMLKALGGYRNMFNSGELPFSTDMFIRAVELGWKMGGFAIEDTLDITNDRWHFGKSFVCDLMMFGLEPKKFK